METNLLNRRERLILTAIEIINELGVQGLSVREVARRQGISNATLFNYFKSKNDLLLAVLDHFSQFDIAIIDTIKTQNIKGKQAIEVYVDSFATYYENYPEITAIGQAYEIFRYIPELEDKIKSIFASRANYIKEFVEDSQKLGELRVDYDSESIADLILGSIRSICLKWRINHFEFSLKERIQYSNDMILNSFSNSKV